jgi:hypothetical protein
VGGALGIVVLALSASMAGLLVFAAVYGLRRGAQSFVQSLAGADYFGRDAQGVLVPVPSRSRRRSSSQSMTTRLASARSRTTATCGCASTCSPRPSSRSCGGIGRRETGQRMCSCSGWRRRCCGRSRRGCSTRWWGGSARTVRFGAGAGRGGEGSQVGLHTGSSDALRGPYYMRDFVEDLRAVVEAIGNRRRPLARRGRRGPLRHQLPSSGRETGAGRLSLAGFRRDIPNPDRLDTDFIGRHQAVLAAGDWPALVRNFNTQVCAGEAGCQKLVERFIQLWRRIPLETLKNFFLLDDPGRDVRPLLPALRAPTLVLHGEVDRLNRSRWPGGPRSRSPAPGSIRSRGAATRDPPPPPSSSPRWYAASSAPASPRVGEAPRARESSPQLARPGVWNRRRPTMTHRVVDPLATKACEA